MKRSQMELLTADLVQRLSPKKPSVRDLDVFEAVHCHGLRQDEVARKFELSQGRVAQICKEVHDAMLRTSGLDDRPEQFLPYLDVIGQLALAGRIAEIEGRVPRGRSPLHLIQAAVNLLMAILEEDESGSPEPQTPAASGANITPGTCRSATGGSRPPEAGAWSSEVAATGAPQGTYAEPGTSPRRAGSRARQRPSRASYER